ncbi:MAG TPA: hypothetical protein VJV78_22640 [Polyangiales bacterium]|nr:hypothetical protein [Polyangiales bacterium]
MRHRQMWLIGSVAALSGAAIGHLFSQLPPERAAEQACIEQLAGQRPRVEPAAESATTRQREPPQPERADPSPFARLVGHNSMSLLTLEQHKLRLRHSYGALFEELGLSADEVARLLAVLSSQEQRNFSRGRSSSSDTATQDRAELEDAIGGTKAAAFEQLRATLPARLDLRRIRDQLEEAGQPMTSEQQRMLLDILRASGPDTPPREDLQRYQAWIGERDRGIRQNAAAVLSPAQLQTLDEARALRDAMQTQLGALRAQAGAGG